MPSLLEPANGSAFIAAWLDFTEETPAELNAKLNRNFSAFHFTQTLPFGKSKPTLDMYILDKTGTNTAIYLSIYLNQGTLIADLA